MNIYNKVRSLTLVFISAAFMGLCTAAGVAAAETTTTPELASDVTLSPEVRHALDEVYLAAQGANMLHPVDETTKFTSISTDAAPVRTRDPVSQMVASGLGVAAGVLVVNMLSGGWGTASRFYTMTGAMIGATLGDYVYRKHYAPALPAIPAGVAQRVSP
jgi:uncharacterized protein YcfJ